MLRFDCNPPRTSISTPSYRYMRTKSPCPEITSRNAKISTLDPYNFFLAGFCYTIFYHKSCIKIYIIYLKFAPILRSQKKVIFLCSAPSVIWYARYISWIRRFTNNNAYNRESVRTEPVRVEPVRKDLVHTEPVRVEPVRKDLVQTEPVRTGPV